MRGYKYNKTLLAITLGLAIPISLYYFHFGKEESKKPNNIFSVEQDISIKLPFIDFDNYVTLRNTHFDYIIDEQKEESILKLKEEKEYAKIIPILIQDASYFNIKTETISINPSSTINTYATPFNSYAKNVSFTYDSKDLLNKSITIQAENFSAYGLDIKSPNIKLDTDNKDEKFSINTFLTIDFPSYKLDENIDGSFLLKINSSNLPRKDYLKILYNIRKYKDNLSYKNVAFVNSITKILEDTFKSESEFKAQLYTSFNNETVSSLLSFTKTESNELNLKKQLNFNYEYNDIENFTKSKFLKIQYKDAGIKIEGIRIPKNDVAKLLLNINRKLDQISKNINSL